MTSTYTYVLDANILIEAARRYYAFDIAPVFWKNLEFHASGGHILSIDRVKTELKRGKDELAKWVDGNFSIALKSTQDFKVIQEFQKIMNWVQSRVQFRTGAKAEFAKIADGWLIAYAKVNN